MRFGARVRIPYKAGSLKTVARQLPNYNTDPVAIREVR
jgi:hypothetical protein